MDPQSQGHSSDGQSSGGKKRKAPRKNLQYTLHDRSMVSAVGMGRFSMEMPSDLKRSKLNKDEYLSVFFDVKDEDQLRSYKIMKALSHPNILAVYLLNNIVGQGIEVYHEPYSGVVSDILNKMDFINGKTGLIPSAPFREIVSDVVDGLNYLIENGQYHGNFAWDTSYYSLDRSRRIVKLANFERRSHSLLQCHVIDCVALGHALTEIADQVRQLHPLSTCLIDDLSRRLISVTPVTVERVMRDIKNEVFFWDERRKKTFYAVELPAAWNHVAFIESFSNSLSVPNMPWTAEAYQGFMAAMEVYRDKHNIEPYDNHSWTDFLKCISGMYTHETELDVTTVSVPVDTAIHDVHPRLCLDLKVAVDQANHPVDPVI